MSRITNRSWTADQIHKLQKLVNSGASIMRISIAVDKCHTTIRNKAKELGIEVLTNTKIRAKIRDAERDVRR